ncbi:MAG: DUF1559 domain-containing protein [Chthoniobacterales bacterium]|nr:DUF1559 domain-containing protein [Chthoniobacterales bacterium]
MIFGTRVRQTTGFTLIEILASVLVILVLMALLFVGLKKVRETASSVQCMSNLRQIGLGFRGYIDEYGCAPPHWGVSKVAPYGPNYLWTGHIAPYMGAQGDVSEGKLSRVFDCPADPDSKKRPPNRGFASTADNWSISYGFNYVHLTSQLQWSANPANLRGVRNFSTLVLAADSVPLSRGGGLIALISAWTFLSNPKTGPDFRHPGQHFNAVFLDGHVQPLDADSLKVPEYWEPLY